MVGGRADKTHARRRVSHLGDPGIDLFARELAALARFGTLSHLDLELVGAHAVLAGDAEAAGGYLLDPASPAVAVRIRDVAARVFSALARVAPSAEAVHGDGQGFVRLRAYRTVRHGPGTEPFDDGLNRLHLFERHRRALAEFEFEKSAQRAEALALIVHPLGIGLEDIVTPRAGSVLQAVDRLRIEEVVLAIPAPLVLSAHRQLLRPGNTNAIGAVMVEERIPGDLLQPNAAYLRGGLGKIVPDELLVQADGLKNLSAPVA